MAHMRAQLASTVARVLSSEKGTPQSRDQSDVNARAEGVEKYRYWSPRQQCNEGPRGEKEPLGLKNRRCAIKIAVSDKVPAFRLFQCNNFFVCLFCSCFITSVCGGGENCSLLQGPLPTQTSVKHGERGGDTAHAKYMNIFTTLLKL